MPAVVDRNMCIGCKDCLGVCPVGAIAVDDKASVDAAACIRCESCVYACPIGAIRME